MAKPKRPEHVSRKDWDDVESPELTAEELSRMRPAAEVLPRVVRRFRGAQKTPTKIPTTIRLDRDVVEHFKSKGRGWQTNLNATLRKAIFG